MSNQNVSQRRYYLYIMLIGVFTMTTLASLFAPGIITWWYDSPAPTPITAACVPAIEWAIRLLQIMQLCAAGMGALIGLIVAFRFRTRTKPNPLT